MTDLCKFVSGVHPSIHCLLTYSLPGLGSAVVFLNPLCLKKGAFYTFRYPYIFVIFFFLAAGVGRFLFCIVPHLALTKNSKCIFLLHQADAL